MIQEHVLIIFFFLLLFVALFIFFYLTWRRRIQELSIVTQPDPAVRSADPDSQGLSIDGRELVIEDLLVLRVYVSPPGMEPHAGERSSRRHHSNGEFLVGAKADHDIGVHRIVLDFDFEV